jgi:hypothetical protein
LHVVIAFDPHDPRRQGTVEDLDDDLARLMIREGRARPAPPPTPEPQGTEQAPAPPPAEAAIRIHVRPRRETSTDKEPGHVG